VITKFNRQRKRLGQTPCSEDASPYCKARAKLSVELIDPLGKRIVDLLPDKALTRWKWNKLNVYLVAGLVFRAPDTQANREVYPRPLTQKEGLGFPQVRAIVTDLLGNRLHCQLQHRCRTPENLDREIAVGVLAYNLVRSLMNDAAAVLEIHPREVSFSCS